MTAARENAPPPASIGGYRLDAKIGTGAMGTVYRAHDVKLGRDVALKVVDTTDADAELRRRFLQEGVAAARVRHPNVVQVLDAGKDGTIAYLAMQLLEGETLSECLQRQGRLPVTYAIDLFLPVCAALKAAHEVGVLHRDLKPANIFLAEVGRGEPEPMLLDFGISKIDGALDTALTQNPRFLGTPLYIAPEQADGAPGSPLSDQYSLALSLYECLLGVRPFEKYRESLIQLLRHVAEGDIPAPRDLDASIPEGVDDALRRALSTAPQDRFPSLRDFGAALLPYASEARRALWQLTFIDAERTMTSANGPVGSDSPRNRKVRVSVDSLPVPPTEELPTQDEPGGDDFLSHSALFGSTSERAVPTSSFDGEQSSISRRTLPEVVPDAPGDPYSRAPSARPISDSWPDPAVARHQAYREPRSPLARKLNQDSRPPPPRRGASKWIVAFSVVIALVTLVGTVALLRHEFRPAASQFDVAVHVEPPDARLELDGQAVGEGSLAVRYPKDGTSHRLVVRKLGYQTQTFVFQDEAPPEHIRLAPLQDRSFSDEPELKASATDTGDADTGDANADDASRAATAQKTETAPAGPDTSPAGRNQTGGTRSNGPPSSALTGSRSEGANTARPAAARDEADTSADSLAAPDDAGDTPTPGRDATDPDLSTAGDEPSISTGNLDPWAR